MDEIYWVPFWLISIASILYIVHRAYLAERAVNRDGEVESQLDESNVIDVAHWSRPDSAFTSSAPPTLYHALARRFAEIADRLFRH